MHFCSPLATPVDGLSGQHGGNVVAFPVKSKPDHSELIVFLGVNERQRDPDISALVVKELSGDVDSL